MWWKQEQSSTYNSSIRKLLTQLTRFVRFTNKSENPNTVVTSWRMDFDRNQKPLSPWIYWAELSYLRVPSLGFVSPVPVLLPPPSAMTQSFLGDAWTVSRAASCLPAGCWSRLLPPSASPLPVCSETLEPRSHFYHWDGDRRRGDESNQQRDQEVADLQGD